MGPKRPNPSLSEFFPTSSTYFLPTGKIGRLAFIFRFFLLNWPFGILVGGIVGAVFGWVIPGHGIGISPSELFMLLSVCYLHFVAIAKRLHDLGEPTCRKIYWIFIPIANLVFLITLMFSSPLPMPNAATTTEQTLPASIP